MEPKFQSSFIPKSPVTSTIPGVATRRAKERSLFSFLATVIFVISLLLALGMVGTKFYLRYRINQMGVDLSKAREALQSETIHELIRLDDRIVSAKDLISKHYTLTPLFDFLESSTPRTVRFDNFSYSIADQGPILSMKGEARGYSALALQADILNKSQYFKNIMFSNLTLNERGDIIFSLKASVEPSLVSYQKNIEGATVPVATSTPE